MKLYNPYRRIRNLERQAAEQAAAAEVRLVALQGQVAVELRSAAQSLRDMKTVSDALVESKDRQIAFLEKLIEKTRGDESLEREYAKRLVDSVIRDKGLPGVAQIPVADQGGPIEEDPDEVPFEQWAEMDEQDEIDECVAAALADKSGTMKAFHEDAAQYEDPSRPLHATIFKKIRQAETGHQQGPVS